jgi:hypothetical protein
MARPPLLIESSSMSVPTSDFPLFVGAETTKLRREES